MNFKFWRMAWFRQTCYLTAVYTKNTFPLWNMQYLVTGTLPNPPYWPARWIIAKYSLNYWWRHSTDQFSTYKRKGWTTSVSTLSCLLFSVTYPEHWSSWCSPVWTSPSSGLVWPSWQSPGQPGSSRSTGLCINIKLYSWYWEPSQACLDERHPHLLSSKP